jgi:uncharacterized protein
MKRLNGFDGLALVLAIIGAVNWGLVGFFNYDLVADLFGANSAVSRIIYSLVGLAGVYLAAASPWFARVSNRLQDGIGMRGHRQAYNQ